MIKKVDLNFFFLLILIVSLLNKKLTVLGSDITNNGNFSVFLYLFLSIFFLTRSFNIEIDSVVNETNPSPSLKIKENPKEDEDSDFNLETNAVIYFISTIFIPIEKNYT